MCLRAVGHFCFVFHDRSCASTPQKESPRGSLLCVLSLRDIDPRPDSARVLTDNIRCLAATPALSASISLFVGHSRFAATSWNFCRDFDDDEEQNCELHSHAASCLIDHGIVDQHSRTILSSEFLSAILWRLCRAGRALLRAISAFFSSFGPLSNTTMQMPMSQSHKTSKSHKTQMQNAPRMQCKEKKEKGQNGSSIKSIDNSIESTTII